MRDWNSSHIVDRMVPLVFLLWVVVGDPLLIHFYVYHFESSSWVMIAPPPLKSQNSKLHYCIPRSKDDLMFFHYLKHTRHPCDLGVKGDTVTRQFLSTCLRNFLGIGLLLDFFFLPSLALAGVGNHGDVLWGSCTLRRKETGEFLELRIEGVCFDLDIR